MQLLSQIKVIGMKKIFSIISIFLFCGCQKHVDTLDKNIVINVSFDYIGNALIGDSRQFVGAVKMDNTADTTVFVTVQWDNYDSDKLKFISKGLHYTFSIPSGQLNNQPYIQTGISSVLSSMPTNVKVTDVYCPSNKYIFKY